MAIEVDEELLQDFLIEAGEILEQLNEQLVELENSPDDMELLNTVFRGFHTIKGGAGFMAIESMVEVCHRAEDVFNMLRNGERKIDANLMDTILPVLDVLNEQFENLRASDDPVSAPEELLAGLDKIISGTVEKVEVVKSEEPKVKVSETVGGNEDITDEEFEALLDALEKPNSVNNSEKKEEIKIAGDDITDEEFELLLDEMHGKGGFSSDNATIENNENDKKSTEESENISDDEFEALLDDIHGEGGFSTDNTSPENTTQKKKNVNKKITVNKQKPIQDNSKTDKSKTQPAVVQAETTVRVDTQRLDQIMNMVGELVLVRNRINRLGSLSGDEEMLKAIANLDVVTADLQLSVMKTRMQPIKKVFGRFPRVVRDLSRSLNKEIKLEMQGEDTDLDKNLVDALADPLVHLVRNSVDHGIEMPDEREKNGKPRAGTVILAAEQEGDHILLSIEDDGAGMEAEKLRKIAVSKGLLDQSAAARLEDKECFNLIFLPGFSSKEEISDISGRGVGMDVVKTRISQLNGSVEIDSVLGKGTRLSIKVPLTLAIMPTLMVKLEQQLFALPLVNVNEIFHLDLTKTNIVDGQLVVVVRERTLPLFYLSRWMVNNQSNAELPNEGHVVVVQIASQRIGFVVDELVGQEEVVIKPLGALLHGTIGLAGATITGDGGIAIILDIPGLMKRYA